MKKRIVSLLLILAMCLTFLGGCGASQSDVPDLDVTQSSTDLELEDEDTIDVSEPEPEPEPEPGPISESEPESVVDSEPAPQQTTIVDEPDEQSVTVYITNTGEKYHRAGCQYLRKSKIPISLDDAEARGYSPCSKCW